MCIPYGFDPVRIGAGLPRFRGLEQVLRPSPQQGQRAASPGNGQGDPRAPVQQPSTVSGAQFGTVMGPIAFGPAFAGPMFASQEGGALIGGPVVDPLYLQASLIAHAWPVQALLESVRRQYGGI
jgi:hypothetical protein